MRCSAYVLTLSLGLAAACTEPHFAVRERGDGGDEVLDAGPKNQLAIDKPDAKPPALPTVPEQAKDLLGDYAVRLRLFGHGGNTGNLLAVSHEMLSVVQVKFDPERNQVLWISQMCRDHADANLTPGTEAGVRFPELYPLRTLHVEFADGGFSTSGDGRPMLVGYNEQPPAGCEPGKTVASSTVQGWLNGAPCTCPSDTSIPMVPEDCRLTDPDADGHPGFTVSVMGGPLPANDYCVTSDDSQAIEGKIDPDGHHSARYVIRQDSYQVQCAGGNCTRESFDPCKGTVNGMLLAPLGARPDGALWSCADMLRAVDEGDLLPNDLLTFPSEQDCNPKP